ncbi:MAG: class I SAM-dependent methyltransferase [Rhodospirillales bacterium]|nr:class I SAM-dependent methyltransferase [Rhodospirillales bacterium]
MTPNLFSLHDPLTRAAIRQGSDKFGGHLYTPVYNALFAHLREQPLKLLEIGIGGYETEVAGGLSLRTWLEYFPYAEITGLDIFKKTLDLPERARIHQGSQTDLVVLGRITDERGPFDIIVDDGSHDPSHMIESFTYLYPRMKPDGIYAIEDTQTCFSNGRNGQGTIFTLAAQVSLAMHRLEGFNAPETPAEVFKLAEMTSCVSVYRNIVVFHRGPNTYPSNSNLKFENEEVRGVFAGIEAEALRNPAPGSVLSRIDMLIWAGEGPRAAELARAAALRYPHERALLHELARMMGWAGQHATKAEIQARLDLL